MFYSEFYADRKRAIDADIKRNLELSTLAYSNSTACKHKGKQALKALQRLRAEYDAIVAAENREREMWEAAQAE